VSSQLEVPPLDSKGSSQ